MDPHSFAAGRAARGHAACIVQGLKPFQSVKTVDRKCPRARVLSLDTQLRPLHPLSPPPPPPPTPLAPH